MDQVPDIQMEVEHPAPKVTAPAKPRGTAMMDAPGWSYIDPGNIVTGGRSTRRSAGNAMHVEEADQVKASQGMILINILQSIMGNALTAVGSKIKDFKDEEEDNQISIGADSNDRKAAPTGEVPRIKEDQLEDFVTT